MADYAIPKRASLEEIQDILKAYYIEGAHSDPVSTSVVEDTADLGQKKVGRQTSFLDEIGLIKKVGSERQLTNDGEAISEALMSGNTSLAKSLMREVLKDWEFTDKIEGFVRMQQPEPVESSRLMEYLTANADSNDRRGRSTLLDLLAWTEILEESEDGYTLTEKSHSETTFGTNKTGEEIEETQGSANESPELAEILEETEPLSRQPKSGGRLQINIEFSGSDDPDDAKELVEKVRRALENELPDEEE